MTIRIWTGVEASARNRSATLYYRYGLTWIGIERYIGLAGRARTGAKPIVPNLSLQRSFKAGDRLMH